MRFGSVCSGIEAASVAWEPIGWKAAWFAEIEPFPCAVLKHHYPDTPNRGDMNLWKEWPDAAIDVLCGGTPCQSFSVAGLRKGLDDPRGNLMLTFLAIAKRHRPRWLVWENVPGVLSSNGGRDFGSFLGGLAECGYGFAYRVLDAQYFGLAQRRKRVFVVAHLGNWRPAAAVLFERESLCGHPAPRREAREVSSTLTSPRSGGGGSYRLDAHDVDGGFIQPVCPTLRAGGNQTGGDRPPGTDVDTADSLIPVAYTTKLHNTQSNQAGKFYEEYTTSLDRSSPPPAVICQHTTHTLRGEGFDASEDGTGRGTPLVPVHAFDARQSDVIQYGDKTGPLDTDGHSMGVLQPAIAWDEELNASVDQAGTLLRGGDGGRHDGVAVAFAQNQRNEVRALDVAGALAAEPGMKQQTYLQTAMQVRRLTPVECEKLQGFPPGYTAIPWRGKQADQCPDGPRYKALGNSWAVPVVRWIGERINLVESVLQQQEVAA